MACESVALFDGTEWPRSSGFVVGGNLIDFAREAELARVDGRAVPFFLPPLAPPGRGAGGEGRSIAQAGSMGYGHAIGGVPSIKRRSSVSSTRPRKRTLPSQATTGTQVLNC